MMFWKSIAGYVTFGQVGDVISFQALKAFRRHSSSQAGSCLRSEIMRTMSSFRPRGTVSASIGVSNPYLYSRVASCSIVSVDVLMRLPLDWPRWAPFRGDGLWTPD